MSRAEALVGDIKNQPEVSQEEHDANKPGGEANPATDAQGWLWYLTWLHRKQAGSPLSAIRPRVRWSEDAARDLNDVLAENPVYVPLHDGTSIAVYPKGDYALDRIAFINAALHFVVPQQDALKAAIAESENPTPQQLEALKAATELRHQLEREFIWILITPGSSVPWDDDGNWDHDIPDHVPQTAGYDWQLFVGAHAEVNALRLTVLSETSRTYARGGDSGDLSKDSFNAVMAKELGVSPRELVRRWSKGMLYGMAFENMKAHERARAKAEAKAK
ncbi:MAG: hypothetical protein ACO1Q7_15895 [Gemmatimonas sp.]